MMRFRIIIHMLIFNLFMVSYCFAQWAGTPPAAGAVPAAGGPGAAAGAAGAAGGGASGAGGGAGAGSPSASSVTTSNTPNKYAYLVTIDSISHIADKVSPFDQDFQLSIPIDSSISISDIYSIQVVYMRTKNGSPEFKMHNVDPVLSYPIENKYITYLKSNMDAAGATHKNDPAKTIDPGNAIKQSGIILGKKEISPYQEMLYIPQELWQILKKRRDYLYALKNRKAAQKRELHELNKQLQLYKNLNSDACNLTKGKGSFGNLTIKISQIRPEWDYAVVLTTAPTGQNLASVNNLNFSIALGNNATAANTYTGLINSAAQTFSNFGSQVSLGYKSFSDTNSGYLQYYTQTLKIYYDSLLQRNQTVERDLLDFRKCLATNLKLDDLLHCDDCRKSLAIEEFSASISDITTPWYNLVNNFDPDTLLANGLVSVQDFGFVQVINMDNTNQRITNLTALKTSLTLLQRFLSVSSYRKSIANTAQETPVKSVLGLLSKLLPEVDGEIQILKRNSTNAQTQIRADRKIFYPNLSYGTAESQDLKTAAGNYLIPDIGLADVISAVGPKYNNVINKKVVNVVTPYWGVDISFRPINKNTPISKIKHLNAWYFLSMNVGLSAIALTREGGSDLIKTMSFVNGISVRPTRFFRITTGYFLYKIDNPNPIKPPGYMASPTLSFSVDLDVVSWISQLTGKIF